MSTRAAAALGQTYVEGPSTIGCLSKRCGTDMVAQIATGWGLDMQQERYRVAQWATGHTGMHSLRKIIEHPQFDLVGLYVYVRLNVSYG